MDWETLEVFAVSLKEQETELLRDKAGLAYMAVMNDAMGDLAELWGCSKQYVNTLAKIDAMIGGDYLYPDVPLGLYRAALDTDSPVTWLQRALDEGWSSRQLRDAADVAKGRRVSRVPLAKHRAEVVAWEGGIDYEGHPLGRIELNVPDWEPSGEPPVMVEFQAYEVLEKGEGDGCSVGSKRHGK